MRHIIILILYITCTTFACQYQIDDVVSEHTNYSAEFSEHGITIEFLLEEYNIPYFSPQEYLFATNELKKNLINNSAYDHIPIFIASKNTMNKIEGLNTNIPAHFTEDTNLGEYIILIHEESAEYDCERYLDMFLHELTHAAIYIQENDPDTFHTKKDLWKKQKEISKNVSKQLCLN